MATGKRYYWMKLKDSFMTSDAVDYLMSQTNGANYVVLYQILCLKTINTNGKLARQIGEIIIPYDEEKIARDTKWFSVDTVRVALNLYKALGLIYQDIDGNLVLVDHNNLVGSETDYAERNRRLRACQRESLPEHNVYTTVSDGVFTNEYIDNRDKILDNRDKILDNRDKSIDIEKEDKEEGETADLNKQADVVIQKWNGTKLPQVLRIKPDSERGKRLRARLKDYGIEDVLKAVDLAANSDFLQDQHWFDFGWFVRPENFVKVLEGKYNRNGIGKNQRTGYSGDNRAYTEHNTDFSKLKPNLDPDDYPD